MHGPVVTDVRQAPKALEKLWAQTNQEYRTHTGNIVVITELDLQENVLTALTELNARHAKRQIVGIIDPNLEGVRVEVSIFDQRGRYIERLVIYGQEEHLCGAILPLLQPGVQTYVWWATYRNPNVELLEELAELADLVIADTVTLNIPQDARYELTDLNWARTLSWREITAQLFDSPEAAALLNKIEKLDVYYAEGRRRDVVAKLYLGWFASRLGWNDLSNITLHAEPADGRGNGEILGFDIKADGATLSARALNSDCVDVNIQLTSGTHHNTLHQPMRSIAALLGYVLDGQENPSVFEASLKNAKAY
ncbi:glucose-6-phosphate dehydrogenase assembly protein OpcA [Deinococcus cellulosilyticus]|uniref:Glucose-6-phosphate dehydrogenase n=1 Tax=Deinococcus cellulosilyticus (strain DSM 18568 / NBRC 106333 / KACC 11606 / 5516J-15) TaxID=1223518 RepID=A0A511N1S5_DEIC1|nr:glucose-6-phosphate dehydrogenase assembly protein OpcA [Deinococcus cellulosilyticus]GEM46418.1 glucose-6-phosphate dehydrogenase [Deinococcus cellulosilyticus NBRC 106333 = KACC 11606]